MSIYIQRLTWFHILIRAVSLIVFQSTAGLFLFLFRAGPSPHYAPPPSLSSLSLSLIPWAHSSHSCFLVLQAAPSELAKYCANSVHILPLNETPRLTDCLSSSLVRGKRVIFFLNLLHSGDRFLKRTLFSPAEVLLSKAKLENDLFPDVFTTLAMIFYHFYFFPFLVIPTLISSWV